MGEFTLYLAAFALIIFLAVLILEFSKPKRQKNPESPATVEKVYFNRGIASEESLPADYATTEKIIALQARVNGVQQKAEMAHSRLDDMEKEIVLSKNRGVKETGVSNPQIAGIDVTLIEERLGKLDNFSASTEKEIKALKEIIADEISSNGKRPYSSYDEQKRKDDEYLQSVIFSGRKKR